MSGTTEIVEDPVPPWDVTVIAALFESENVPAAVPTTITVTVVVAVTLPEVPVTVAV